MIKKQLLFLLLLWPTITFANSKIDSILHVLDRDIELSTHYQAQRDSVILCWKQKLKLEQDLNKRYKICVAIYDNYYSYQADSTLKYILYRIQIAKQLHDKKKVIDSRMDQAALMSILGMYTEALGIIKGVNKDEVPELKFRYFFIYKLIYGFMTGNAVPSERSKFERLTLACRDSMLKIIKPNALDYVMIKSDKMISDHQNSAALKLVLADFPNTKTDLRRQAYYAYHISHLYKDLGNREKEKEWLIISAINDIRSTNKDYISLRSLAYMLYEDGDVDRAYVYIKKSLEDALACNARLRTFEISAILPIIDKAYQSQTELRHRQMQISLLSICVLALFLIIAVLSVYSKMRKLSVARSELSAANQSLTDTNNQMQHTNIILNESNLIKEEYIGRYIDLCSIYIDKLDEYRRLLNKTAISGKIEELLLSIKSKKFIEDEIREFYTIFDSTFLQLFPSFVTEFSALQQTDEFVQLKPGQLLNTELRIYALMRLGIEDGVKISRFLHCSASTIYNYRTKIRNNSFCERMTFDEKILLIGSI